MTSLATQIGTARAATEQGLATTPAKGTVLGWLRDPETKNELVKALPRGTSDDADRFLRIVQTEIRKNPALLEANYQSFGLAVNTAAQLGLEPGPLGLAYLTGPRKSKATGQKEVLLILGYKGLKELAYRAGTVDFIDAVAVHEGEHFRVVRGSEQRLEHEEREEFSNNPIKAYYAIAFPKSGGRPVFDVMWPKDIEAIRKRSSASDHGPWVTDYEAMALKTVTRRLLTRGKVRLTADVQTAIVEDEARELGFEKPTYDLGPALAAAPAVDSDGVIDTDAQPIDVETAKGILADEG